MIFSNCGIANIDEDPTQLKSLLYQDALLLETAILLQFIAYNSAHHFHQA